MSFRGAAALVVALLAAHLLGLLALPGLQRLDHALYDVQLRRLAPKSADNRIVMVDIDERSLAIHGRWPWRRAVLADLLDKLVVGGGARLVGLDLVLAEADHSSGLASLEAMAAGPLGADPTFRGALDALRPALDDDARLAEALQRLPVVLAFHLSNDASAQRLGALPTALWPAEALGAHGAALLDWRGHGGNLPQLQRAAQWGAGHLNGLVDDDGVLRRVPLLVRQGDEVHGALALVMARHLLGEAGTPAALHLLPAAPPLQAVQLRGPGSSVTLPVDGHVAALVPFRALEQAFVRVSAADVLSGRAGTDVLRGKVVLVGVSAPGLIDQRHTPVDASLPGTLVHAHLLSGMLDGRLLASAQAPSLTVLVPVALLLATGLAMVLLLPRLRMALAAALAVAMVLVALALQYAAWAWGHTALPLAPALLLPPLLLALHLLVAYRSASNQRQQLVELFGQYVPPELVTALSQQPGRAALSSRSAEISVLFADVRGFTALAEHMPPGELSAMMNLLFSRLTDTVRAHRGTLDKYIGDSVMAFWGAPLDDPDHARHAVEAALAMRMQLPALQDELAAHGWPRLDLSIGIDSGNVVVGDMGSRHRRAYTAMGDAVNRAARVQSLAAANALGLVVGAATRRALGDRLCLPLGQFAVRGRETRLALWQPLPLRVGDDPRMDHRAAQWQQLHDADEAGDHDQALQVLRQLESRQPADPLCAWQRRRWRLPAA